MPSSEKPEHWGNRVLNDLHGRWSKTRQPIRAMVIFAVFAALTGLRFLIALPAHRNSDDANNFLAGIEMARGNLFLHGWILAPDNYFPTDITGEALLYSIFGFHPAMMQLHEAIVWALVTLVGASLAKRGKVGWPAMIAVMGVVTVIAFTVQTIDVTIQQFTTVASHGFTILLALLTFQISSNLVDSRYPNTIFPKILIGILCFLGSFSDPIYIEMAALPVLICCLLRLKSPGHYRAAAIIVAATAAFGHFFGKIIHKAGGFESSSLKITFATYDEIIAHLSFGVHSIIRLFGSDFTGLRFSGPLLNGPLIHIIRFPLAIAVAIILIQKFPKFLQKIQRFPAEIRNNSHDFIDDLLLLSIVLGASAAMVTTVIVDDLCVRYFIPAAVCGIILVCRHYATVPLFAACTVLALSGSVIKDAQTILHGPKTPIMVGEEVTNLITTLDAHQLYHGYSGYWQSSIITALTHEKIRILSIKQDDTGVLSANRWFTNLSWYRDASRNWRGKIFFIARKDEPRDMARDVPPGLDLTQGSITHQFGTPDEVISSGVYLIDVYGTRSALQNLPTVR